MENNVFLNEEESSRFRKKIKERGRVEKERIQHGIPYVINRIEQDGGNLQNDIETLHGFKPSDLIAKQLQTRKDEFRHRKFKILDMGGGSGAYADQLQDMFKDTVKIYTTGLAKQAVKEVRRDGKLVFSESAEYPKRNLPKDYLKWRSILELNKTDGNGEPLEEFDFIINSYGEIPYGPDGSPELTETYLRAIIAKLRPNGIACISPIFTHQSETGLLDKEKLILLIKKLEQDIPSVTMLVEEIDPNKVFRLKIQKRSDAK